jgi:broad specificity phosphatase PhoE
MLIRHDTSEYNLLKGKKKDHPVYKEFLELWEKDPDSERARTLALQVKKLFALETGDHDTGLADEEATQAQDTGRGLKKDYELPDIIFVSPYKRTLATLEGLTKGWPELAGVRVVREERIREQEHGLQLIYNDYRVFQTLHPEQRELKAKEGRYWYRFPQGENVPDVRLRNLSWITTLVRDYAEKKVMVVTHHLNILATRANFERLGADEFIRLDDEEAPINCGVSVYKGNPDQGTEGRLELTVYNKKYY